MLKLRQILNTCSTLQLYPLFFNNKWLCQIELLLPSNNQLRFEHASNQIGSHQSFTDFARGHAGKFCFLIHSARKRLAPDLNELICKIGDTSLHRDSNQATFEVRVFMYNSAMSRLHYSHNLLIGISLYIELKNDRSILQIKIIYIWFSVHPKLEVSHRLESLVEQFFAPCSSTRRKKIVTGKIRAWALQFCFLLIFRCISGYLKCIV